MDLEWRNERQSKKIINTIINVMYWEHFSCICWLYNLKLLWYLSYHHDPALPVCDNQHQPHNIISNVVSYNIQYFITYNNILYTTKHYDNIIIAAWSSPTCMWQSTPTSEKQFKDWFAGNHHHHHPHDHRCCHQSWLNPSYFNLTELHSNVNAYQADINLENCAKLSR